LSEVYFERKKGISIRFFGGMKRGEDRCKMKNEK
jgi:hypothetical protein